MNKNIISEFKLKSIFSNKLKKNDIKKICLLKDKEWKYGFKKQIKWFQKYVKNQDIHNLLYHKSKLVGYTLLRKRGCKINGSNKKKFIFFDTLIIDKKYRGKKISYLLMALNNMVIKRNKLFSILICKKKQINFYKNNGWFQINNKNIQILDHKFSSFCMIYSEKNINNKYILWINK